MRVFEVAGCAWLLACSSQPETTDASSDAGSDAPNYVPLDASITLGKPNGTMGQWQAVAPLPSPRANFCATVVGSTTFGWYLVVIGGNSPNGDGGFTALDEVLVAGLHPDGTIEPWKVAAHTPSPVTECTVAGSVSDIYLLDGIYDDASKRGHNFTATFLEGVVGAWNDTGTLPIGDDLFDDLAFVLGGQILATTSKLTGHCALLTSNINSQQIGWGDTNWLNEFRGRPQWANAITSDGPFAYVIGGYSDADAGNVALATGAGTTITATINGYVPGFYVPVAPLPAPTTFGMAASADDYVFMIGGRSAVLAAPARADVLSAQAATTGGLGAWTVQPSLPAPRTNGSAVVGANYLYVIGGADTSDTDTVFAAQVRF